MTKQASVVEIINREACFLSEMGSNKAQVFRMARRYR